MGEDRTRCLGPFRRRPIYLSLPATLAGLGAVIALFVLARWRAGQPLRPERGPRLIPWTLIAIIAAGVGLFLIVHLVEFTGYEPGSVRRF